MMYGKEMIVMNKEEDTREAVRDADRIIALALMEHLYHKGKISELVYRNIKKDTLKKISVENRKVI
jgi:recombinational DNA repair protein (RecF pathway)